MASLWERLYGLATMPPEQAQQQVADAAYNIGHSLLSLPKQAFGASEEMRTEGTYNPKPILESAMLPMGTGAIAGVPVKGGEVALGAGLLRPKPAVGGYHSTTV